MRGIVLAAGLMVGCGGGPPPEHPHAIEARQAARDGDVDRLIAAWAAVPEGAVVSEETREVVRVRARLAVTSRLMAGSCEEARAVYHRLESVGLQGESAEDFGDWCR